MYKNKNKKYKKYNRNVKQNVNHNVEHEIFEKHFYEYQQEILQHLNNVFAAVDNYTEFAEKLRKLNDKKLNSLVDDYLNITLNHLCNIIKHY